jgi:ATP-dependent protease ClpP protease subunit
MIKVFARGPAAAEVEIYEPIGQNWYGDGLTAAKFRTDLKALGDVKDISVRINSPGGEVFDGFSIYNALKEHPAKVTVYIDGLAASIASVIAMAGDAVYMGEGAMFMVHSPWTLAMGDAEDMRQTADMLDKIAVGLVDAYVAGTNQPREVVDGWMAGETWFTRDEAIAMGLADGISAKSAEPVPAAWHPSKIAASAQFSAFAASRISKPPQTTAEPSQSAPADPTSREDVTMTTIDTSATAAADIRDQALAAEQIRRETIRANFGRHADTHRVLLDACLDDPRCAPEAASAKLLAKLGEGIEPIRPTVAEAGLDAVDKFRVGASAALAARAGVGKRDEGNEYSGATLSDLAAKALTLGGESVRGLSRDAIARKVLAFHTSSDFPNLLSSTAGKVLRTAYEAYPQTWRAWCAVGSVSDFKIHPRIQLGSFNSLATIPEGGEYTYGTLGETYENAQAVTKGKALALTRQMIVNDDLSGFARRAQFMGDAAARTVNEDIYTYLTSASGLGPTSSDTGTFFNATAVTTAGGHANYTSSGTAMTVASLGVGRIAMAKQKDSGLKTTLNLQPAVLLTSVGKEDTARTLLASETDPSVSNSKVPNIYKNRYAVVADPFIDSVYANSWYLFVAPNSPAAAFEIVFLDGNETPFIDDAVDFDTDALKFKIRLDYGTAIGDWRGAYRNVGA